MPFKFGDNLEQNFAPWATKLSRSHRPYSFALYICRRIAPPAQARSTWITKAPTRTKSSYFASPSFQNTKTSIFVLSSNASQESPIASGSSTSVIYIFRRCLLTWSLGWHCKQRTAGDCVEWRARRWDSSISKIGTPSSRRPLGLDGWVSFSICDLLNLVIDIIWHCHLYSEKSNVKLRVPPISSASFIFIGDLCFCWLSSAC